MNDCVKLILILIVILVLFTFVTGAHKGTEHFSTRKCDKEYQTPPGFGACPIKCRVQYSQPEQCPIECSRMQQIGVKEQKCDEKGNNCKTQYVSKYICSGTGQMQRT